MNESERIAAIAAHGERTKTNSAEYLWICLGIKPPLLPDYPVLTSAGTDPEHLQLQGASNFCGPSKLEMQHDQDCRDRLTRSEFGA